jgi:ABC-type transport system substrate-binding protein
VFQALLLSALAGVSVGQEERLFEREPFDRLTTLDSAGKPTQLEILPLKPPNEELPQNPAPSDQLRIRLFTQPDVEYDVAWANVKKIERFQEMVLAEAEGLVKDGQFDEAYDYYAFLRIHYPQTKGLAASVEEYLIKNAFVSFGEQRYDEALAMLIELHRLNPQRAGLINALSRVTEKLVESQVLAGDYVSARAILRAARQRNPQSVPGSVTVWEDRMKAAAQQQRELAAAHLTAGRFRDAYQASRRMLAIWPALPGAEQVVQEVAEKYPLVVVGVTQPAQTAPFSHHLAHPAARRTRRLLDRMLVERALTDHTEIRYFSPIGRVTEAPDRTELTFKIGTADSQINAFDLSQRVLAAAGRVDGYQPLLSRVVSEIAVRDATEWNVTLGRPHVRPPALMLGLPTAADDPQDAGTTRPYQIEVMDDGQTRFEMNEHYALAGPTQPRVVVEQHYSAPAKALKALDRGEIDVLDRVYPWHIRRLRSDDRFSVGSYALPTLHVLVPRSDKPPLVSRAFRRALVYAINRDAILQQQILSGEQIEGCRLISGPFPAGLSSDDPLAYACDPQIEPRLHDLRLAWALVRAAEGELRRLSADREASDVSRPLVLAHPADELVRGACEAIERYLKLVEIPVQLKELPPGQVDDPEGGYDLLYSEWTFTEPAVDVWRLVAPDGPLPNASDHFRLPLRQLDRAATWRDVREHLWQMHRIAHEEVTVVPLWQLVDHFAVRKNVEGIGQRPDTLYARIEAWHVKPWIPTE